MKRVLIAGMAAAVAALMMTGCDEDKDERVAAIATEAVRQQAEQNRRMIDLQEKVATGTQELVEADAEARREMIELHESVIKEQSEVGLQRDRLDEERKSLASERRRETVWAAVIHDGTTLLACLLPLLIVVLLLWPRSESPQSAELSELLIADLSAEQPLLIVSSSPQALPAPDSPG